MLLHAAALDLLGVVLVAVLFSAAEGLSWAGQMGWMFTTTLVYLAMGWLLGTYTLLGWRRLPRGTLLQRLGLALLASLVMVAVLRWWVNPPLAVWAVHRRTQLVWLGAATLWSLLVRVALRRGVLQPEEPRLLLVAPPEEAADALRAWRSTPRRLMPRWLTPEELLQEEGPLLVAVSPGFHQQPRHRAWLEALEQRDPRQCSLTTPLALAERQLERLPPVLVPEPWLSYDAIPWATLFSPQSQLKRVADVLLALLLLLLGSPLLLLAALLIWLEDRGPVLYVQRRSGWLGEPFHVLKLRTMAVAPRHAPATWTVPGDARITRVGQWLRSSRLDELPQLVNVLRGDMSLIGPRPERPELEAELEAAIPHYRKRHWMRPGLSGWAQVCAPYAASVEDSELKLSYDLYYLKHFSTWLDLVILLRTIKTVLKVAGR